MIPVIAPFRVGTEAIAPTTLSLFSTKVNYTLFAIAIDKRDHF